MKQEYEGEYFKKILMDFFRQTGGSEEMEKAKEHDGCMGCVHVDLASDDYPCSECSCNYTDKYQKREEAYQNLSKPNNTCEVDLISREDAMGAVQDHFNADGFKGYYDGQKMMDRITALSSAEAVQGCDGSRYDTRPPQKECLYCKRYWRDSYERKGGDAE